MPLRNQQRHPCRSPKAPQSSMRCLPLTKITWRNSTTHSKPRKLHVSYFFPCDIDFVSHHFPFSTHQPISSLSRHSRPFTLHGLFNPLLLLCRNTPRPPDTHQQNDIPVLNDTSPSAEISVLSTRRCWHNSTSSGVMYNIN